MKRMIIYLLGSICIAAILSLWTAIDIPERVIDTLYTVAGVIFSVGMSITISSKTDMVSNPVMKKSIRKSYIRVRDSFMYYFGVDTLLFITSVGVSIPIIPKSFFSNLSALFLIISISYYIYNFIRLQSLGEQIEDQILKEKIQ